MSKKWPLVVGGVVVVVTMLVAGQTLLSREPSSPGSSNSSTASPTDTATSTTDSAAGTRTAQPMGTTGAKKGDLGPFPPMPTSSLPPRKLTAPARSGEALSPLSDAPDATISALKVGTLPNGSTYSIRMRPYGFGPASSSGSRVVIRIDSAEPVRGAPKSGDLAGTNVIALIDTTHSGTVLAGGAFSATLSFRSDGKMLYPVLSEVRSAK